jgi:hypothetical protein
LIHLYEVLDAGITHVKRNNNPLRLSGTKERLCESGKLDLGSVHTRRHLVHVHLADIRAGDGAGVGHCEADLGAESRVHHLQIT